MLVREGVRMKNKVTGLLMKIGQPYGKEKLHRKKYFYPLLEQLPETQNSVRELLAISRSRMELALRLERRLLMELAKHSLLAGRVERLQTIRGVGPVLALTWALEVGEPERFASVRQAISYCGLCAAQKQSAGKDQRGPLSKQRNKHFAIDADRGRQAGAAPQRNATPSLRARVCAWTAQPCHGGGGAQSGGVFVGGRSPRARLRSAAAGGLKEEGFSLGNPPPGKAVLAVSEGPPPSQGERRAAAPGNTACGSLPWEEEKDVLLSDDELPAGPCIRRDCATEHYVPEAPSVTVSRPAGRTLTESSARAGGSLLARGSSWMSGPWGPTFDSQTLAAKRDYGSHTTRHRGRAEGSLRRPLDIYLSWMSLCPQPGHDERV